MDESIRHSEVQKEVEVCHGALGVAVLVAVRPPQQRLFVAGIELQRGLNVPQRQVEGLGLDVDLGTALAKAAETTGQTQITFFDISET